MMISSFNLILPTTIAIVLIGFWLAPVIEKREIDDYFSTDYYDARNKFRLAIDRHSNAQLYSLPLEIENYDLTIDIGLFRRSARKLLIIISGTHGVEGFAGSAIQNALLSRDSNLTQSDPSLPTLLFIHSLNPYGFAQLRRWNENNVDLNRNFLSSKEFQNLFKRDPNAFGYRDLYDMINPSSVIDSTDFFWIKALTCIIRYGFYSIKQALVTGNYHFQMSLFFGGQELQPSHVLVKKFLQTQLSLSDVQQLAILDIHTGLGPSGQDSLLVDETTELNVKRVFAPLDPSRIVIPGDIDASDAFRGYQNVTGSVGRGLLSLFPSCSENLVMSSEFGTVPAIFVFKALREENAAYHHAPQHRIIPAQNVRDVFYRHQDSTWKQSIISRGRIVAHQLNHWLTLSSDQQL